MSKNQIVLLWVLVGMFAFCIAVLLKKGGQNLKRGVELKGDVQFTGGLFVIRNDDSFNWGEGKLKVNDTYYYQFTEIKAGESISINALIYADAAGERFSLLEIKPKTAVISAKTPRGDGFYYVTCK